MSWAIAIAILSAGVSYVSAKKMKKKAEDDARGIEANIESTSQEIPVIYGERRVGGVRPYITTEYDYNDNLYMVLVLGEGEIDSVSDIRIDDIPITDERFRVGGVDENPNFWYELKTGKPDQTVSDLLKQGATYSIRTDLITPSTRDNYSNQHYQVQSGGDTQFYPWYDNHTLNGVAYLALKFKYDQNAYTGIPDVTCLVKGKKIYDPRKDSTIGGTGTHRADDQTTWEWSENPALCIRDYLINDVYGKGLPVTAIDDASFIKSANDCDTFTVTPYQDAPEDQKLFEMNAVVDTSQKILDNLVDMLVSCRGFIPYQNGKYSLIIDQAGSSVFDVEADHIIGGITIAGTKKKDRFNQVKINFYNKDYNYKEDQAIYPTSGSNLYTTLLAEDEGESLVEELDIFSIDNYYSARDIARLVLERSRKNMTIQFTATSELINVNVTDVISITHPTPAWVDKLFQVQEITLKFDGTVDLTCVEYDADLYTYDTPDEQQPYIGSLLPDPNTVQPVDNLQLTSGTYVQNDGNVISYIDVDWDLPDNQLISRYDVRYEYNGVTDVVNVATNSYRIMPTEDGVSYTIAVRAVNALGVTSSWVETTALASSEDTTAPSVPTSITVTGGFNKIELSWTNPTESDFDLIDIKVNTSNDEPNATPLASLRASEFTHNVSESSATRYYWLRALDRTGNASEWVYAGSGTTQFLQSGDFSEGVIALDFLNTDTKNIINSVANYDDDQSALTSNIESRALQSEFTNTTQKFDDSLALASERLLSMSLFASEQAGIMRDAGVTVDPDNGTVSIQAVEALRSETSQQFSQVGITLSAQDAEIELRATRTYVNNQIASAQLDPTDFQAFNDLELRIENAELDIGGLGNQILAKVDTVTFNGVDGRLTVAEGKVGILEDQILLKASTAQFTDVDSRLTDAEQTILATDFSQISQTATDVLRLNQKVDLSEIQSLKGLLESYNTRQTLKEDLAFARTQITADVNSTKESIATQRTELLARIDENDASIISESQARATADESIATDIILLRADLETAEDGVTANGEAIEQLDIIIKDTDTGIEALGQSITDINVAIGTKSATYAQATEPTENLVEGDLWIDTDDNNKVYRYDGSEFIAIADTRIDQLFDLTVSTYAQNEEPTTNLNLGDLWIDTNDKNKLYRYDGFNFVALDDDRISDLFELKTTTYAQNDAPTEDLVEGDIWIDTNDGNKLYRYNGTAFVQIDDERILQLFTSKSTSYAQDEAPTTDLVEGDIWIDTNDKNKVHRYNGTEFLVVGDERINDLFNVKTTTFAQDEAPVESAELDLVEGDIWIDTNDKNKLYRFDSSEWVAVDDIRINDLFSGKTTTFAQDDEPEDTETLTLVSGDLWIDTNDNNKIYRYNGSTWVGIGDARLETFANAYDDLTTFVTDGEQAQAIAQAKTELATELPNNSTFIQDVTQGISTESRASARRLEQIIATQASTQLKEILNREDNRINLNDEIAVAREDFNAIVTENRESIVTARQELRAQIDQNESLIISESQARADADSSFASQLTSISGRVTDVEGGQFGATNLFTYVEQEVNQGTSGIDSRVQVIEGSYATVTVVDDKIADKIDEFDTGIFETGIAGRFEDVDSKVEATEDGITASARRTDELSSALIEVTGFTPKSTYVEPVEPPKNKNGDLWWNDSVLKQYSSTSGEFATVNIKTALESLVSSVIVFVQESTPTGAGETEGDLWFAIPEIYRYRNGAWSRIEQTYLELRAIYSSVNFHYGDNEPSLLSVDDVWFDTANSNDPYRWDGSEWVELDIANISQTKTTVAQTASTVDGIKGQYSVTINNNGSVSGYGLVSDIIDGENTSAFSVSADQFSIVSPTDGVLWDDQTSFADGDLCYYLGRTYEAKRNNTNKRPDTNPQDWEDVTSTPFVVYSTDTNVVRDGQTITIPAGTYIKDAFISNLSAGQIKTGTLSANRISVDGITLERSGDNLVVKGGGIDTTQLANGAVTNDKIDSLNADKITAGTISTSRLSIDGVTLDTNASGQLIISENGVDTTQIANGAVNTDQVELEAVNKLADAYTAGGEFILSNVTETVQTISITTTGSPVQIIASAVGSLASGNFAYVSFGIYRDDTIVRTMNNLSMATNNNRSETIVLRDTPPSGTHTYTLRATASLKNIYVSGRYLSAQEVKR